MVYLGRASDLSLEEEIHKKICHGGESLCLLSLTVVFLDLLFLDAHINDMAVIRETDGKSLANLSAVKEITIEYYKFLTKKNRNDILVEIRLNEHRKMRSAAPYMLHHIHIPHHLQ